jgi:multidrug efflux pump subunit AcrA (membrane-fusion protein)
MNCDHPDHDRRPRLHRRRSRPTAATLLLALTACSRGAGYEAASPTPTAVTVQSVQLGQLARPPLRLPGRIEAVQRSAVGFELGGVVAEVLADTGDQVAAGQPLARLDRERPQAAFDAVVAAEAAAQALLAELVAGPRREAIERAEAAVAAAQAEAARAAATATRTRDALAAAAVSIDDEDRASRAATIAAATLRSAQAQLAELTNGTRPEQLDAQRATVARLQAERRRLARDLADLELRAPFAGRVLARTIAKGEVVAAGAPAFDLVADDGWRIRVGVPMRAAERGATALAAAAVATRAERPLAFVPTNASLAGAVDPRVRTVDLLLPLAPGPDLRDGELVHVALPDGEVQGLAVPPAALRGGPRGLFRCLVAAPDGNGAHVARHRDVQVASWLGERVVVTGGLQPGDLLIVSGADHVLAGMPVRPTEVR